MSNPSPAAVLDLGTNSTRFLLSKSDKFTNLPVQIINRGTRITRLGEGVETDGTLSPGAVDRVLIAVEDFDDCVRDHSGIWVGGIATSACRRASNGESLLEEIEKITSIRPEIISGEKEAQLIYKGIRVSLPKIKRGRIVDIGGGSCEWITFNSQGSNITQSFDIGVVTLREKFCTGNRWTKEVFEESGKYIEEIFNPPEMGGGELIVAGGTATTASALKQELKKYESEKVHGDRISIDWLEELTGDLMKRSFEEIESNPMIQAGRGDVIIAGLQLIIAIARRCGVPRITVSDYGILAGLLEESLTNEVRT